MEKGNEPKDYVKFHILRSHTLLYKSFLEILEDIRDSDSELYDSDYQRYRKRILDKGNDCARDSILVIEDFLK